MNRHFLTPKQQMFLKRFAAILGIMSMVFVSIPVQPARALTALTTARIWLNRQQSGLTSGETFELFFTPSTTVASGTCASNCKVKFTLPADGNNNTKWCVTAGSDGVGTGIANPTGFTESATILPGTLTVTCAQSTPDTFTVGGITSFTAGTEYGVRLTQKVSSPVAIFGTGLNTSPTITPFIVTTNNGTTDVDQGTGELVLIANDQLAVTALINPQLTVTYSGNTAALGTLDTGHVNQAGITTTVTTNAAGGYVSLVNYGATLTSGSFTIQDAPGSTLAIAAEGYGVSSSQAGLPVIPQTTTSCTTSTATSNITKLLTTFQTYASGAGPGANGVATTLCFMAGISTSTKPGSYTSTSTLVTTARY